MSSDAKKHTGEGSPQRPHRRLAPAASSRTPQDQRGRNPGLAGSPTRHHRDPDDAHRHRSQRKVAFPAEGGSARPKTVKISQTVHTDGDHARKTPGSPSAKLRHRRHEHTHRQPHVSARRRHANVDEEDVRANLKRLAPAYKRRIVADSLKKRWYLIALVTLLLIGASVWISYYFFTGTERVIELKPRSEPLYGRWGVIEVNGVNSGRILSEIQQRSISGANETAELVKNIYLQAGVPVLKVELFAVNGSEDFKKSATHKDTVLIDHTVHLNESSEDLVDIDMNKVIYSVRRILASSREFLVDPNFISVRKEGVTLRAHSVDSFLLEKFPPLDLLTRKARSLPRKGVSLTCRVLPGFPHGSVQPDDCTRASAVRREGTTCTFTCHTGFMLTGSNLRTCLSTGIWSGELSRCEKTCNPFGMLQNGFVSPKSCQGSGTSENPIFPGANCFFFCNTGYKLIGSIRSTCTENGDWSPPRAALCKRTCPGRLPPEGGHVVPASCASGWVKQESFCTFYCDKGYILMGQMITSCIGNGDWSSDVPVCRKMCHEIKEIQNGKVIPKNCARGKVETGARCHFSCNEGYRLTGSSERLCNEAGDWSGIEAGCIRTCKKIPQSMNLIVSPPECRHMPSREGSKCRFSCEVGFSHAGMVEATCRADGKWDIDPPVCDAVCDELPAPEHGDLLCSGRSAGSTCTLVCPQRYYLRNAETVTCLDEGYWDKPVGSCINTCVKYPTPGNSKVTPKLCGILPSEAGEVCSFRCDKGYGISGHIAVECLQSGNWSSSDTKCEKEDQYLLHVQSFEEDVCLFHNNVTHYVEKREWADCLVDMEHSRWSVTLGGQVKNADSGSCLAATNPSSMSFLTLKPCTESDPLQIWDYPHYADAPYVMKLRYHDLYPWEGYLTVQRAVLSSDFDMERSKWFFYHIEKKVPYSYYGASNGGQCVPLRDTANGRWTPRLCSLEPMPSDSFCSYLCSTGYSLEGGDVNIQCKNGYWNLHHMPVCAQSCQGLSVNNQSDIVITPAWCTDPYVHENTICAASCRSENKLLVGEHYMICLNGGTWSFSMPTCIDLCPAIEITGRGWIANRGECMDSYMRHLNGSICEIECDESYMLLTASTLRCVNGSWDGPAPFCKRMCAAPRSAAYGAWSCPRGSLDHYVEGDNCTFVCDTGFRVISGDGMVTCLLTGLWYPDFPVCKNFCPALAASAELTWDMPICTDPGGPPESTTCAAKCSMGYFMYGPTERTCLLSGSWSGETNYCQSGRQFMIWNNSTDRKLCMVVETYAHTYKSDFTLLNATDCRMHNDFHRWTWTEEGYLKNVGSGNCMNGKSHVKVQQCPYDTNPVETFMKFGHYVLQSSTLFMTAETKLYFPWALPFHGALEEDVLGEYEWMAIDSDGNIGSVSGIGRAACPGLVLSPRATFENVSCGSDVQIGQQCTIICHSVAGVERRFNYTCLENGLWSSRKATHCIYETCLPISLPAHSIASDNACITGPSLVDGPLECSFTCQPGYTRVLEVGMTGNMKCLPSGEWSEDPPRCVRICPALTQPPNGDMSLSCTNVTLLDGTVCNFTCDFNFELVGAGSTTCVGGIWDAAPPSCNAITGSKNCLVPSAVAGSEIKCSSYSNAGKTHVSPNEECHLRCEDSAGSMYTDDSWPRIRCQQDGTFHGRLGDCNICEAMGPVPPGINILPSRCTDGTTQAGQTCFIDCQNSSQVPFDVTSKTDFYTSEVQCRADGSFYHPSLTMNSSTGLFYTLNCVDQPTFKIVESSTGLCLDIDDDHQITYSSCTDDSWGLLWFWRWSRLRSRKTFLCLQINPVSSMVPVTAAPCNFWHSSQHLQCGHRRHRKFDVVNFDSLLKLIFRDGRVYATETRHYNLSSTPESSFHPDFGAGILTDDSICIGDVDYCPRQPLSAIQFTRFTCTRDETPIKEGKECGSLCDPYRYASYSFRKVTCHSNHEWGPMPSCEGTCRWESFPPTEVLNVTPLRCTNNGVYATYAGDECHFSCAEGYQGVGTAKRTCRKPGIYTGVPFACYRDCQALKYRYAATIEPPYCAVGLQAPDTVCTTACNNGYQTLGTAEQTCLNTGAWSVPQAECVLACPQLKPIEHGSVSPPDCLILKKITGDLCTYTCHEGFALDGVQLRRCSVSGLWDGATPKCLRRCPALNDPVFGYLHNANDLRDVEGAIVTAVCNADYTVDRNPVRECTEDGTWTGEEAYCIRESQFLLIQIAPPNPTVCILTDESLELVIADIGECLRESPWYRWAWYGGDKLRNVASDKCLIASDTTPERFLILTDCDENNVEQAWQCSSVGHQFLINLVHSGLIPVASALSASKVLLLEKPMIEFISKNDIIPLALIQWFAGTSESNQSLLCAEKEILGCPVLELGAELDVTPTECKYGMVPVGVECVFRCNPGYIIKNHFDSTFCLNTGYWSNDVPDCAKSCNKLSIDNNIRVYPSMCNVDPVFLVGQMCTFSCHSDFALVGEHVTTCMKNGQWSAAPPRCKRTCPALTPPMYGTITPSLCTERDVAVDGTECTYGCVQQEHILSGSQKRVCNADGTWSGTPSVCLKPCFPLKEIPNSYVSPPTCTTEISPIGTVCNFTCREDHLPKGVYRRTCMRNGTWTETKLMCLRQCLPLGAEKVHGTISPTTCTQEEITQGFLCVLRCEDGYSVIGNRSVTCEPGGKWSGVLGNCNRKCPALQRPFHGNLHPGTCLGSDAFAGITCIPSCQRSYILQGSTFRKCLEDGTWSGVPAVCIASCPALKHVRNAVTIPKTCEMYEQPVDQVCTVACANDTAMAGGGRVVQAKCLATGFWDSNIPGKCYQTCRTPKVESAIVTCVDARGFPTNNVNLTEDCRCSVQCDDYYVPSSHPTSTCVGSVWTPRLPYCIYVPYPTVIVQRVKFKTECLGIRDNQVVMYSWEDCISPASGSRWAWKSRYSLENMLTGMCLAAAGDDIDQPLTIAPCDNSQALQQWDCDEEEPYRLLLRGTALGPSKHYPELPEITIQNYEVPASLFYTFNPKSDTESGTICSTRPEGGCQRLVLGDNTGVMPVECRDYIVPSATTCRLFCFSKKYAVHGNGVVFCDYTGLWSPESYGSCKLACAPLAPPAGGVTFADLNCTYKNSTVGTVCHYSCQPGFILSPPNRKRECLVTGEWSPEPQVRCNALCPTIHSPPNAIIKPTPCVTGTCEVECDVGYRRNGPKRRTCQDFGEWTGTEFSCIEDIQFNIITKVPALNVRMCLTLREDGGVVKEPCVKGSKWQKWRWRYHYGLENVQAEKCLAFRRILPTSRIVRRENDTIFYLREVAYDMSYFRNFSEPSDVHCITCSTVDPNQHWECDTSSMLNQFRLTLSKLGLFLDIGPQFTVRIPLTKTPSRYSRWYILDAVGVSTICSKRDSGTCSPFAELYGGHIRPERCQSDYVIPGTHCHFGCGLDYVREGIASSVCRPNGLWTNRAPSCFGLESCPRLKLPFKVRAYPPVCSEHRVHVGKTCYFSCSQGWLLTGNETMLCEEGMTWRGQVPSCQLTCPPLPPPKNGFITPESCQGNENLIGQDCRFECEEGFDIVGTVNRTCLDHGLWSDTPTVCRKLCPILTLPEYALVKPERCVQNKSRSSTTCIVTCDPGYHLRGEQRLVCANGSWSGSMPTCEENLCNKYIRGSAGLESVQYTRDARGVIIEGTVMTIKCMETHVLSGPTKRLCLGNGSWSGPQDLCSPYNCLPLPRLYHGLVSPAECVSPKGVAVYTTCQFSCDDGFILHGPVSSDCLKQGRWSEKAMAECHDTHEFAHTTNFLISTSSFKDLYLNGSAVHSDQGSQYENFTSQCLSASAFDSTQILLTDCSNIYPRKLWRWYGSLRIQNVASQQCWTLTTSDKMVLAKCELNSTRQSVSCGDVNSPSARLQLIMQKKFLTHSMSVVPVDDTSDLNWVSQLPDLGRSGLTLADIILESEVPVCTHMCGGSLSDEEGDLSTPGYPKQYPADVVCEWTISVPGKILRVDFSGIKLSSLIQNQGDSPCVTDHLVVLEGENGDDESSDVITHTCTSGGELSVKSLHGILHIELHSDHIQQDNGYGFAAHWYTEDPPDLLQDCGISEMQPVDFNNETVISYPWHVAVLTWKRICDGALIGKNFVLTSALCVEHIQTAGAISKLLIAYDFTSQSELLLKLQLGKLDNADKLWVHPKYSRNLLQNNIAVISLVRGIGELQDFLHPACLPSPFRGRVEMPGSECLASGFSSKMLTRLLPIWRFTKIVRARILTRDACKRLLRIERGLFIDFGTYLCAEITHDREVRPPLKGQNIDIDNDGGSVLQCLWNENWYAVGLFNFALDDHSNVGRMYKVYTPIIDYHEWIQDTVDNAILMPSNVFV